VQNHPEVTISAWPRDSTRVVGLPLPLLLFAVAALLRLATFAVFYLGSVLTGHHGVVDPFDSVLYDRWAWFTAQHLSAGQWVDLRQQSLEGSWDVAFTYLVAFEYVVVGHHPEVARIVNCLIAATTAPAGYFVASSTSAGPRVAARAGWLIAVWPLSLYWAGLDLLKDPLVWAFVALGLVAIVIPRWRAAAPLGALAALGAYLVRNYMGPGLAILLLLGAAVQRRWKALIATAALLVVAEVAIVAAGFPANPLQGNLAPLSSTQPLPACGSNVVLGSDCTAPLVLAPRQLAVRLALGIPTVVFGPGLAPLADMAHPTLDWGMYPGLIAWVALIPFAILGLWRAIRRRDRALLSIAVFALGIWASLALIYAGHALRQREMAFPATLILTAVGLERPFPGGRAWWLAYALYLLVVIGSLSWEAGFLGR
jgi:hypothetical protein